jgi:hypothetical protein
MFEAVILKENFGEKSTQHYSKVAEWQYHLSFQHVSNV